jgi:hypothetical protein
MKNLLLAPLIVCLITTPVAAEPAQKLPEKISPRQLYVACSLMISGDDLAVRQIGGEFKPTSAAACVTVAVQALALGAGNKSEERFRFCPQGTLDFDSDPPRAMARAYIEFFEASAVQLQDTSGLAAFLLSQKTKWPCKN